MEIIRQNARGSDVCAMHRVRKLYETRLTFSRSQPVNARKKKQSACFGACAKAVFPSSFQFHKCSTTRAKKPHRECYFHCMQTSLLYEPGLHDLSDLIRFKYCFCL